MLVIMIVLGVFLLWLGTALRNINRAYAALAYSIATLLLLLASGGFFKLF